jgi:xanthine dehydrogenase accessory factor
VNAPAVLRRAAAPHASAGASAWLKPLREWPLASMQALQRDAVLVRIMLAAVRGSAPREPGTVMLMTQSGTLGTIGGGQLEWQALAAARALLAEGSAARLQRVVLGTQLAQCCGGVVELWLERYTRADLPLLREALKAARMGPAALLSTISEATVLREVVHEAPVGSPIRQYLDAPRAQATPRLKRTVAAQAQLLERLDEDLPALWLYGAGHVGQALARILAELPLKLTWIDSRSELLPAPPSAGVRILHSADPVGTVASAPARARFLVLTHSHPLDYALCRSILERGDFAWAGLIGSQSKAARFRARLARDGVTPERIARLVCPIGVEGIESKWPAAIAVGVAAQVLRELGTVMSSQPVAASAPMLCAGERCAGCDSTW